MKIEIETDIDAFQKGGNVGAAELRACFERILKHVEGGATGGGILDTNGKRVGRWDA